MRKELQDLNEALQNDVLNYLDNIDPDSIMYTKVDKDNLCEIITERLERTKNI